MTTVDGPIELRLRHALAATAIGPEVDIALQIPPVLGEVKVGGERVELLERELEQLPGVSKVTVIPPSLYLRLDDELIREAVVAHVLAHEQEYGSSEAARGRSVDVNFSDPNANKPLHIGHLRNNFLGTALAGLLAATGHRVDRSEFVSDWGIHICQAAVGHRRFGDGATPESSGVRGDRLVGRSYVRFHEENARLRERAPHEPTELEEEASALLRGMELGDREAIATVLRIAGWAEAGIRATYERIGTRMDMVIRESEALELGQEMVTDALARGLCRRRDDGSVFFDMSDRDMGELTFLRRDGTQTVYTRGVAVLVQRARRSTCERLIDLLGSHWQARYTAALEALRIFGYREMERVEPFYFGMVRSREGAISSREGTDLLADDVIDKARERLSSEGVEGAEEAESLALALLKYHFLAVRAQKAIAFDDDALWKRTLPRFARLTRTLARLGKARDAPTDARRSRRLLLHVAALPGTVARAADRLDPAPLVHFVDVACVEAAKSVEALGADDAAAVAIAIRRALGIVEIRLPHRLERLPAPLGLAAREGRPGVAAFAGSSVGGA